MVKRLSNMVWGAVLATALAAVAAPAQAKAVTTAAAKTAAAAPRDIINEIIDVVGLQPRFELQAADIENAAAVIYNGKRYILYNENFLNEVNNAVRTDWAGVSILAHEIGHHLNGHTLSRTGSNPADELESDEFSGFVLRKMGASEAEAQAAMRLLSEERNSKTHPGRSYRLAAISKGWHNADAQILASANGSGTSNAKSRQLASARPVEKQVAAATTQEQPRTQRVVALSEEDVLSKVNFSAAPREQFYLTKRLNLVHITADGLKIVGKLTKTNNREVPYFFQSDVMPTVFVTDKGILLNKKGQRVGHFS